MKMYRTTSYDMNITELDVVSTSEKTIVYIETNWRGEKAERREKRESTSHGWHDSHDAAMKYLIDRQRERVIYAEHALSEARAKLYELKDCHKETK